jgi:hypothetical protein
MSGEMENPAVTLSVAEGWHGRGSASLTLTSLTRLLIIQFKTVFREIADQNPNSVIHFINNHIKIIYVYFANY